MQTHLGLIFVLHVIAIGCLMGRAKRFLLPFSLLLSGVYFFLFYLGWGLLFERDPEYFRPEVDLSHDYYWVAPKDPFIFSKMPLPPKQKEGDDEGQVKTTP